MMAAELPAGSRNLRACTSCKLIKSAAQFRDRGCDNCEKDLRMADDTSRILQYTTPIFQG
jgi:transcription elongation factor SPT4